MQQSWTVSQGIRSWNVVVRPQLWTTHQPRMKQGQELDQTVKARPKAMDSVHSDLSWGQIRGLSRGLWVGMEVMVLRAE